MIYKYNFKHFISIFDHFLCITVQIQKKEYVFMRINKVKSILFFTNCKLQVENAKYKILSIQYK